MHAAGLIRKNTAELLHSNIIQLCQEQSSNQTPETWSLGIDFHARPGLESVIAAQASKPQDMCMKNHTDVEGSTQSVWLEGRINASILIYVFFVGTLV